MPFPGGSPLARRKFEIGLATVVVLVLLRLNIGWHFLTEGLWKLEHPSFSAEGFLRQSRGPFQDYFLALVPDVEGRIRLNAVRQSDEEWNDYWRAMAEHYGFSEGQQEKARHIYEQADRQIKLYLEAHQEEIAQYFADLEKLKQAQADPAVRQMPYQKKRSAEERAALAARSAAWLDHVDALDAEFKQRLAALLTDAQKQQGALAGSRSTLDKLDFALKYGLVAIGLCLLAGLFTRFACLSGALFLATVVVAQPAWPGAYPQPSPAAGNAWIVNKEFIEMMALLALATTRVGRWGGLDFFVHYLVMRPIFGRRKNDAPQS